MGRCSVWLGLTLNPKPEGLWVEGFRVLGFKGSGFFVQASLGSVFKV